MRALFLVAGAALAVGACNKDEQAANTLNVDESLSAEKFVSNDVTAIDAVTGADANMAADVNYFDDVANSGDAGGPGARDSRPAARGSSGTARPKAKAEPATKPAANSSAGAPADNAT